MNYLQKVGSIFKRQTKSFSPEVAQVFTQAVAEVQRRIGSFIRLEPVSNRKDQVKQYESLDIFYSVVLRAATLAANIDIKLMRKTSDGKSEEVFEHPILDVLANPSPDLSWEDYLTKYFAYFSSSGDFFSYGLKSPMNIPLKGIPEGAILEMVPLPSQHTIVLTDPGIRMITKGYSLDLPDHQNIPLDKDRVMHIKNPRVTYEQASDAVYGLSPLSPLYKPVRRLHGSQQASITMLKNGGPRGMVTQDPKIFSTEISAEGAISKDDAKLIKAELTKKYQGEFNLNDIIVTAASLQWQEIGASAADLGMIDAEKWSYKSVCNALGFDARLFNANDTTGLNASEFEVASRNSYTNGVIPRMKSLVKHLNKWLVPSYGDSSLYLEMDTSKIPELQANFKEMADWVSKVQEWTTPNEIRVKFGWEKLEHPDADTPIFELRQMGINPFGMVNNNNNQIT